MDERDGRGGVAVDRLEWLDELDLTLARGRRMAVTRPLRVSKAAEKLQGSLALVLMLHVHRDMAGPCRAAGIHVSLVIIDGVVDLPATRQRMPDKPDSFFVEPDDVAETVFHLTTQPRSAWSFEVEARPFGETW